MRKRTTILPGWWIVLIASSAHASPILRPDLQKPIGQLICAGSQNFFTKELWSYRIFDAQIIGTWDGNKAEDRPGYSGYVSSLCANRRWVAWTHSAFGVEEQDDRFVLPEAELATQCRRAVIAFAPAAKGDIQILGSSGISKKAGDGTVGVQCYPKTPKQQGPSLWFLLPVGRGPLDEAPFEGARVQAPADILQWVNRARAGVGRAPLIMAPAAAHILTQELASPTVQHDRSALKSIRAKLAQHSIVLLGEDRVQGDNLAQAVWLLWNSPLHRHLLLRADAHWLDIHSQGTTLVLVLTRPK